MTFEEEKELVTEKLGIVFLKSSNPLKNRNLWPEIFEKFTWVMVKKYIAELVEMAKINKHPNIISEIKGFDKTTIRWKLHTAKPEICWKALIKTLKKE